MSIISNLAPALVQTFLTILVGYLFGRYKWMPVEGVRALGMFVTTLALPALLLRNMATLDLSNVRWSFFLAILIAKALLFAAVAVVCILRHRGSRRGLSDAGCYAIFVTQSNDLAMGLPILGALFGADPATANFASLLYVIAPISLAILNPIGFLLMEMGREPVVEPTMETIAAPQQEALALPASAAGTEGKKVQLRSPNGSYIPPSPRDEPAAAGVRAPRPFPSAVCVNGPMSSPAALSRLEETSEHSEQEWGTSSDHDEEEERDEDEDDEEEEEVDPRAERCPAQQLDMGDMALDGAVFRLAQARPRRRSLVRSASSAAALRPPAGKVSASGESVTVSVMPLHVGASPIVAAAACSATASELPPAPSFSVAPLPQVQVPSAGAVLLKIVLKVLLNPVVLCVLLGLVLNFALSRRIPAVVDSFLAALGNAFSALALFVLGVNMVGKLALFRDRAQLLTPVILISLKSLALPVLVRLMMGALDVPGSDPLTLCAFVTGTFPTAPSVPFFALDFGAQSAELMAPAMVLGTFAAAPVMFVSAQMVTVALSTEQVNQIVSDSTRIAAGFGAVAAVAALIVLLFNRRWREVRHRFLLSIVAAQAVYTAGLQFCVFDMGLSKGADVRFWFVMGSLFFLYVFVALLAINELVRRRYGPAVERRCYPYYNLCAAVVALGLTGGLFLFGSHPTPLADLQFCSCWFRYGKPQLHVILTLIGTCAAVVLVSLVSTASRAASDAPSPLAPPSRAESTGIDELPDAQPHQQEIAKHGALLGQVMSGNSGVSTIGSSGKSSASPGLQEMTERSDELSRSPQPSPSALAEQSQAGASRLSLRRSPEVPLSSPQDKMYHERLSPPSSNSPVQRAALARASMRDSILNGHDGGGGGGSCPRSSSLSTSSSALLRHASSQRLVPPSSTYPNSFWLASVRVFLIVFCGSMLLSFSLYCWSREHDGTRVVMQLLDAVALATTPLLSFALFAAGKSPLKPIKRWMKRKMKGCCRRSD